MNKPPAFTLEGRNLVFDALSTDKTVEKIFVSKKSKEDQKVKIIIRLAQKKGVPVSFVNPRYLAVISRSANHQGVIGIAGASTPATTTLNQLLTQKEAKGEDPFLLLFNRLDYEQNLGAILRSAWGAGVDAVIVPPQGVHEITPVVARASMGGSLHVPLIVQSLFQSLKTIKDHAIPVVGVDMRKGHVYSDITLRGPVAFVLGGEDSGVSDALANYCDIFVHIPMDESIPSLNVSVSAALVMFEKVRQERSK